MKWLRRLKVLGQLLSLVILVGGFYLFTSKRDFSDIGLNLTPSSKVTKSSASSEPEAATTEIPGQTETSFPNATLADWEVLLVNRQNIVTELNPEVVVVENILVDSRIAEATTNFLAAARQLDANFHLISGYRSVADQANIYQGYVNLEMTNQGLTEEEAIAVVQTYSQPAGASEHHTGLAIDMSTVDALNQADATVMAQVHAMAPDYGFVLRFPEGKQDVTGIGYEDWHFRYVGVENAKYMTERGLTLEEFVEEVRNQAA